MTKEGIAKLRSNAKQMIDSHKEMVRAFPMLAGVKTKLIDDTLELAKGFLELVPDPYAEQSPNFWDVAKVLNDHKDRCYAIVDNRDWVLGVKYAQHCHKDDCLRIVLEKL